MRLYSTLLVYASTLFSAASSDLAPVPLPTDGGDEFSSLLNSLPADSLHAALFQNLYPKFRDGVWEHDRHALEALRNDNPPLATRVLADAALELVKRQNSNSSTAISSAAAPPPPTPSALTSAPSTSRAPTTTVPSSSSVAVVVPVVVSTTNSAGSSVVTTTSAVAPASVNLVTVVTVTDKAGATVVVVTTVPGALVVSDGVTTTSPVSRFIQSSTEVTTTNAAGSTFVTTYTPDAVGIKSLVLSTTTLPDGRRSTVTSFAAVMSATAASGPRLQQNAAQPSVRLKLPDILLGMFSVALSMLILGGRA